MDELTDRQRQILDLISSTVAEKGYPPTVREICRAVGLRSPSTVHSHLAGLEEKGYIRRDPSKGRAIEILSDLHLREYTHRQEGTDTVMVPLVGRVTAGIPVLAVENVEEMVPLPRRLVHSAGNKTFLLRVEGTSMVQAGILDGDLVIVRRQPNADNGDIVVALMEGEEATVKRFFREKDHIRLQPEHPTMAPIRTTDVQVLGKVVGLFRQLS
ncbi:MAG: transcriptional repressor LexA [Bacillota bacterium]